MTQVSRLLKIGSVLNRNVTRNRSSLALFKRNFQPVLFKTRGFCTTTTDKTSEPTNEPSEESAESKEEIQAEGETTMNIENQTPEQTIEDLKNQIIDLQKQSDDFKKAALEYKAEIYNIQTRSKKELENQKKFGIEKFAKEVVVIADNLDLAIQNVTKPAEKNDENKDFLHYMKG
eukprot:UN27743